MCVCMSESICVCSVFVFILYMLWLTCQILFFMCIYICLKLQFRVLEFVFVWNVWESLCFVWICIYIYTYIYIYIWLRQKLVTKNLFSWNELKFDIEISWGVNNHCAKFQSKSSILFWDMAKIDNFNRDYIARFFGVVRESDVFSVPKNIYINMYVCMCLCWQSFDALKKVCLPFYIFVTFLLRWRSSLYKCLDVWMCIFVFCILGRKGGLKIDFTIFQIHTSFKQCYLLEFTSPCLPGLFLLSFN